MDDQELGEPEELGRLEQTMRAGLQRRAEQADVALPVIDRVRPGGRRRGLAVGGAIGLVAASLVTVVVVESLNGPAEDRAPTLTAPTSAAPKVSDSATAEPAPEVEVRTEYFGGIQVEVPADWGWGSSPVMCGEAPVGRPYVGRPVPATDACGPAVFDAMPTAPYVWLGADVPPGSVDLGAGWTRETIEVEGTTVSVATQEGGLRTQILGSVTPQDRCASELTLVPEPLQGTTIEGVGDVAAGQVCAYRRLGEDLKLVFARDLPPAAARRTFAEVSDAPTSGEFCKNTSEVVVVQATYNDPYSTQEDLRVERSLVYDLTCGTVEAPFPRSQHRVTEATAKPWATDGALRHILVGTYDQWAYDYFIGIQG